MKEINKVVKKINKFDFLKKKIKGGFTVIQQTNKQEDYFTNRCTNNFKCF